MTTRSEPTRIASESSELAVVALLPVLGGAISTGRGLALGVALAATLLVTRATAVSFAAAPVGTRLVLCALVAGAVAVCGDLATHAWLPDLHAALGPFLIAAAPAALLQASVAASATRAATSIGALVFPIATLSLVGTCRELLGAGTLLADAGLLVGLDAAAWKITTPWHGFLVATQLPGALLSAALLMVIVRRLPKVIE